jgi:hypothetical protein
VETLLECEGSFPHTFLHSRASLLAHNLASPCIGCEPKAKVATYIEYFTIQILKICTNKLRWKSNLIGWWYPIAHSTTTMIFKQLFFTKFLKIYLLLVSKF